MRAARARRLSALLCALAVAAPCALTPGPARAQGASSDAVAALDLAEQLAELGEQTRSPLPLLTAATLVLDRAPRTLVSDSGATSDTLPAAFDVRSWVERAALLGKNDEATRLIVAKLRARLGPRGGRGSIGGPRAAGYRLDPGQSHELVIPFTAGSPAAVRVRAPRTARVDCEVRGESGDLLTSDQGMSACFLNFVPGSARVRIAVHNAGTAPASYVLITN